MMEGIRRLRDKVAGRQNKPDEQTQEDYGLFLLHPEPGSAAIDIDIVAVHGLGGHWKDTWTDDAASKLWLRDFVPAQFPATACRIWSFGYNSRSLSNSVEDIDDAATSLINSLHEERQLTGSGTKPIIFIAHSLGGIVVKRALILANERSDYWKDVRDSAFGALFLGVPHRGADKAYWAALAVTLVEVATFGLAGNKKFVKALKRNSSEFSKISTAFIQPGSKLKMIRSFYETVRMGNDVIVDKDSATIGTNNELSVAIQGADHRHMCKFDSDESQKYRPVRNALTGMVTKATEPDLSTVRKQADAYIRRLSAYRTPRSLVETCETQWILNMTTVKEWERMPDYAILHVEYDEPLNWQASISTALSKQLKPSIVLNVCLRDLKALEAEQWNLSLPRTLTAQLFAECSDCMESMNELINDIRPDEFFYMKNLGGQLDSSWENSYCSKSPGASWQQQWILLGCALRHMLNGQLLITITGLETEDYQFLDEGLRFLFPGFYLKHHVIRHRLLIVGKPRSEPLQKRSDVAGKHIIMNISSELGECLSSLHFPELHSRRNIVKQAETGTTQWIWNHPAYKDWLSRNSSLLWVHGKPGSGKSTLAATLRCSLSTQSHNILLADFFYSARGGTTGTSHAYMLRSILHQLLQQDSRLYSAYQSKFRQVRGRESFTWRYEDLADILLNLQGLGHVYDSKGTTFLFILDGLDESDEASKKESLRVFPKLCHLGGKNIFKIIALSRPELPIKRAITPDYSIDMKNENYNDIEMIIQRKMGPIWRRVQGVDDLSSTKFHQTTINGEDDRLDFVRQHLLKHADGVILWVALVLQKLDDISESASCTVAHINQALTKMPTSLKGFYHEMFKRVEAKPTVERQRAEYIISWLLLARTTLRVCEMRDVMAMSYWKESSTPTDAQQYLDLNRIFSFGDAWNQTRWALHEECCGFMEIVPKDGIPINKLLNERPIDSQDTVQLIHQTAREFLLSTGSYSTSPETSFGLDNICSTCVDYLSLVFDKPLTHGEDDCSLESVVLHLADRPLLGYILSVFPAVFNEYCAGGGRLASSLRQKIAAFADNAEQNRWVSVTWWLFRPWIQKVLPQASYEYEDKCPKSLENALQARQMQNPQYLKQLVLSHNRGEDSTAAVPPSRPGSTEQARQGQQFRVPKMRRPDPYSSPPPYHFWLHCIEQYWLGGIIHTCLLIYGMYAARRLSCSIALDVLVKASSDSSGEPSKIMNDLAKKLREGDINMTDNGPSCCIHLLPYMALHEVTVASDSRFPSRDWIEDFEIWSPTWTLLQQTGLLRPTDGLDAGTHVQGPYYKINSIYPHLEIQEED